MADTGAQTIGPNASRSAVNLLWLVIAWTWVGVPLAWGVWQTVIKSLPLFESFRPHVGQ
jgi:hypothetical protein